MAWKRPHQSGICSAGNGAAIRGLVIGAYYADNLDLMSKAVSISTLMTHISPKANEGAMAVALAAATAINSHEKRPPVDDFFYSLKPLITGEELKQYLLSAQKHLALNSSLADYLSSISMPPNGVSGYINHTVPAVIYAWLRYYGITVIQSST